MQAVNLSAVGMFDYVRLTGADAIGFLQGQASCDVQKLTDCHSLPGALCNIKGRVIADFRLLKMPDDSLLLQTCVGMGQKIIDTLARYAVFSKVELQLSNGPTAVFGIINGPQTEVFRQYFPSATIEIDTVQHSNDYTMICLPGSGLRHEIWCHNNWAVERLGQLPGLQSPDHSSAWNRQDILAGTVHVRSETSEKYTPQLLNYDLSGVIDFNKGCYTGQEVVARMHYRSKAKKRLYLLRSKQSLAEIDMGKVVILSAVADESGQDAVALGIISTKFAAENPSWTLAERHSPISLQEFKYRTT
ncbi:MAG: hypothetical protein OXE78_11015 [Gammaproteobacteria bacterium]|nr:hypothetical protein [Gammaproteobacteria bacterium]